VALPGRALLAAGLLAAGVLAAAPVEAAPATHRQASSARPAKASGPARPQPVRRVAHRHRAPRADTAAHDPGGLAAHDPGGIAVHDPGGIAATPAVYGPTLAMAHASPRAACLAAARQAERLHGLPEGLMVAIALSESGLHAHALNIRGRAHFPEDREAARALVARAGGRGFAGCVQISLGHARGSDWPLDPVQATDWAGALLARAHAATGSWSAAVARFHGGSPAGSRRVICRVRAKLEVAAPGSPALRDAPCGGDAARERRNGAALLEIAEAQ
jgi:hypothetical protein